MLPTILCFLRPSPSVPVLDLHCELVDDFLIILYSEEFLYWRQQDWTWKKKGKKLLKKPDFKNMKIINALKHRFNCINIHELTWITIAALACLMCLYLLRATIARKPAWRTTVENRVLIWAFLARYPRIFFWILMADASLLLSSYNSRARTPR